MSRCCPLAKYKIWLALLIEFTTSSFDLGKIMPREAIFCMLCFSEGRIKPVIYSTLICIYPPKLLQSYNFVTVQVRNNMTCFFFSVQESTFPPASRHHCLLHSNAAPPLYFLVLVNSQIFIFRLSPFCSTMLDDSLDFPCVLMIHANTVLENCLFNVYGFRVNSPVNTNDMPDKTDTV